MAEDPAERVSWTLVEFDPGGTPTSASPAPQTKATQAASPAPAPPDPKAVQLLVVPPRGAAAESIALKPDLSDAAAVLPQAVRNGYFVHGAGYFEAIQAAVRSADNAYQGGQQPLTTLTPAQLDQLGAIVADAIKIEGQKITKAVLAVQGKAAKLALQRLKDSLALIKDSAILYVSQASDESRAKAWLEVSDLSGGARAIIFNEDALDLVKSILVLRTYFLELAKKDAALGRAMRSAGPEMQQIAASRWTWLRGKDRKNTPSPRATISSKAYGVELMDASNPARPDLVAQAKELFPDPASVTASRKEMLEASAALTSTMVDEGAVHPILYRIWSPELADSLFNELQNSTVQKATVKIFEPVFKFRLAISQSLRSAYAAANSLHGAIKDDAAVVWKYPLLINATLEAMGLAEDAYPRVIAEHTLVADAEAQERLQRAFMRTSEVLLATQLAIRFVPAPEVTVPVALVIGALDTVVGGIALLYQYFTESATRDAYRAFLLPADCFAASDGSYVGIVIGAAFLLFGTLGLKRATLTVPSKGEIGMAVAGFGLSEYLAARGNTP
jgi:hypothetical protein